MKASDGSEYVGWIIGALLGFLWSTFIGMDFLVSLLIMVIGAIVGGAVGYALWAVFRR